MLLIQKEFFLSDLLKLLQKKWYDIWNLLQSNRSWAKLMGVGCGVWGKSGPCCGWPVARCVIVHDAILCAFGYVPKSLKLKKLKQMRDI